MERGDIPASGQAERAARQAEREAAPWIEKLARFGFAAKGVVYVLVGGLAAAAAFGSGGQTTGSSGALSTLSGETWGQVLLGLIAFGLVGYVVWRAFSAIRDPENDSGGKRAFYAITALVYAGLALEAARLALGGGGSGGDTGHWTAQLMQQPFGQILVGIAGLAIALYGVHQLMDAWQVDLDEHLALGRLSATARTWVVRFGRFGLAARGLVFTIIGGYLLVAAFQSDPSEARGIDGVLDMMRGTSWLLGVVALGLVAYGLYNLVRARYRVIRPASG